MPFIKMFIVVASLIFSALSIAILLTILRIVKRLSSIGGIAGKTILLALSLLVLTMFLEVIHMALVLSDVLGIVKPKIFIPPDLPYSRKYVFLWFPSQFLYLITYILIFLSIERREFLSITMLSFLAFSPILFNVFSSIVLALIIAKVRDFINYKSPIFFTILMFLFSHLVQIASFMVFHLLLYFVSVMLRLLGLLILYYGFLSR